MYEEINSDSSCFLLLYIFRDLDIGYPLVSKNDNIPEQRVFVYF